MLRRPLRRAVRHQYRTWPVDLTAGHREYASALVPASRVRWVFKSQRPKDVHNYRGAKDYQRWRITEGCSNPRGTFQSAYDTTIYRTRRRRTKKSRAADVSAGVFQNHCWRSWSCLIQVVGDTCCGALLGAAATSGHSRARRALRPRASAKFKLGCRGLCQSQQPAACARERPPLRIHLD